MKKWLYILSILFLFITSYVVVDSYGLFETNADASISMDTGKWVIKLNNTDISSGIVNDFVIDEFIYTTNSNVSDGYIAPGRSGYFDIVIDPTGTDVAVRYDVLIDIGSLEYPENISFNITDMTNGNAILTAVNTYTGVISLSDIANSTTVTLRVNVNWTNDNNYDGSDTDLAGAGYETIKISIPVEVNIKQYLGETIVAY